MNQNVTKILKNSIFLYIRMAILMLVSFYVTRVVLKVLGTDGYGLYNLVGSVVAIFASLKALFATSVQRFLNYYKGKGNFSSVADVFNIGVVIHLFMALLFGICVEIVGLYLIHNKLNIPPHLFDSALFVFHCSVVTACVSIITIPYDAVIIANEKMGVYALLSVLDGALKLAIALSLPYIITNDKISAYALLLCLLSVLLRFMSSAYCRRFPECKKKLRIKKDLFKDLLVFSSWNFLGNLGYSLMNEVINIFLNIFGGVAVNSAKAIAYQVRSAIQDVSTNFSMAANPRIVQGSAKLNVSEIYPQIIELGRITYYITYFLTIPIFVFLPIILNVWLDQVPHYTIEFTRFILLYLLIRSFHSSIDTLFKAYGKLGKYQICDIITLLLNIPIAYIVLKAGGKYEWVFLTFSICEFFNLLSILVVARKQLGFASDKYMKDIFLLLVKTILPIFPIVYLGVRNDNYITIPVLIVGLIVCLTYVLIVAYITSNEYEKYYIKTLTKSLYKKVHL